MSEYIKGDLITVQFYDPDADFWGAIVCLTSNALANTRNIIEAQTKCDPGQIIKAAGSLSYELTFEGNEVDDPAGSLTYSFDKLREIFFDPGEDVYFRMATGLTDNPYYYGNGVISDLELTAPAGDEFATFSGTLAVSGRLSLYDDTDSNPTSFITYYTLELGDGSSLKPGIAQIDSLTVPTVIYMHNIDGRGFTYKSLYKKYGFATFDFEETINAANNFDANAAGKTVLPNGVQNNIINANVNGTLTQGMYMRALITGA